MPEQVPFTDIYVDDDMIDAVGEVLRSGRHVKGPVVERFERAFAAETGVKHAVGVSNGTAALLLSMKALDVGERSEVFAPAHSYFATISPAIELGADPTFIDIDSDRYTMDPKLLRTAVESSHNPAAIAVTHMHGQPADMDPILSVAEANGLPVIEDCAQAHLAEYRGETVGSMGDVGCFSFYPTKNMTVGGDGGMITTDDDEIATKLRALRNHGRNHAGAHIEIGLNYRLDEVSGAVGVQQLEHLPKWNQGRRRVAELYDEHLAGIESILTPTTHDDSTHVYHHYPIQINTGDRELFRAVLREHGVDTGVHYDRAMHEHPAIREYGEDTTAPIAESFCERTASLPMHPRLSIAQVKRVVETIKQYDAEV
jgi:dTDP-4-amino-4,6-dideoxygalactose transaminase